MPQFGPNHVDILKFLPTNDIVILSKFYKGRAIFVDWLLKRMFCLVKFSMRHPIALCAYVYDAASQA